MSVSRFFAVLLVFIFVGPPVGAVIVSLVGSVVTFAFGDDPGMVGLLFYSGLLAIPLSSFVGGIQAAVAGLTFAIFATVAGRPSAWAGLVGGLVAGLGYLLRGDLDWSTSGVVLIAHVVAAAVCGMIATSMLRERRHDAT